MTERKDSPVGEYRRQVALGYVEGWRYVDEYIAATGLQRQEDIRRPSVPGAKLEDSFHPPAIEIRMQDRFVLENRIGEIL